MAREYGVLYIQPERLERNAKNGQFLPGMTPHNKGKKWDEWMSKKGQQKVKAGWKNLRKRPTKRPDVSARFRKGVIAIDESGRWRPFPSLTVAAVVTDSTRENIRRCCKLNKMHRVNKKTGAINTNYKHNGLRWYYEEDSATWFEKISQQ